MAFGLSTTGLETARLCLPEALVTKSKSCRGKQDVNLAKYILTLRSQAQAHLFDRGPRQPS